MSSRMGYCIAYVPSFFIPLVFAAIMGLPMTVRLTGLSAHCTRSNPEETSTRFTWVCADQSKCKSDTLGFDGSSWATFIMQTNQTNDRLSVQFRTRESDQLLLYTVIKNLPDPDDPTRIQAFMAVYLLNGSLIVTVERYVQNDIPSFQTMSINRQMDCISNYGTCADKQWHQFTQALAKNTVLLSVDGQPQIKQSLPYSTGQLSIEEIYAAHSPPSSEFNTFGSSIILPRRQFRGCFRHLAVRSPVGEISLVSMKNTELVKVQLPNTVEIRQECDAKHLAPHISQSSSERSTGSRLSSFVTFSKPGGYLRTSGWRVVSSAELSFKMQTTEPDGLLLYGSSVHEYDLLEKQDARTYTPAIPGAGKAGFDIIALELREGRLVGSVNSGSGVVQLEPTHHISRELSKSVLTDGQIHNVDVKFHEGNMLIRVDNKSYISYIVERTSYKYLNLNGIFYIGGVPNTIRLVASAISPEVWSIRLNKDFVGCIGDLTVNNQLWDIDLEMRACWAEGFVHLHCYPPTSFNWCATEGCKNGGVCSSGWNRHMCDCDTTNFGGEQCSEAPLILGFNGHQWLRIQFGPFPVRSLSEELLIRFRTRQLQGLLFTTYNPSSAASDCFEVRIDSGQLLVIYDFGEERKKYTSAQFVADHRWHTLRLRRRDRYLNFSVDNYFQIYDIPRDRRFLSHKHIILGRLQPLAYYTAIETFPLISSYRPDPNTLRSVFIGHIMKFVFNGVDFLHVSKQLLNMPEYSQWKRRLEITATEGVQNPFMEYPVSLASQSSYVAVDLPDGRNGFSLQFWVKTDKDRGPLLVYTVQGIIFFALEIVNGHLEAVVRPNGKVSRTKLAVHKPITDVKWHKLQISSNPWLPEALVIGSEEGRHTVNISIPLPINNQTIFIGGYPMTGVQDEVGVNELFTSRTGFSGCVASIALDYSSDDVQRRRSSSGLPHTTAYLEQDAHTANFLSGDLSTMTRWNNVSPGCNVFSNEVRHRYDGHCTPRICHFDGRCVQQLGATRCDCSMTSLAGKYCTDVGAAIHLSSNPLGVLKFELSPPQNTTRDHLAFGIQATKRGPRSLVTIKGHGASTDFLRVSLIPLKSRHVLLVRYNMGGGQQTLLEHNVDIADGRYHVVQLIRDGANCMLRIDLEHERVNIPKGTQGMHFNDIKYIHVGTPLTTLQGDASTSRNQSSSEYDNVFEGYITGLNYNGIDLLQVVNGLIIPGIFLSAGHDVNMKSSFQPNMEHLRAAQKRSDSTVPLTANDMQVHSRQNVPTDHRSEPLIVPRINCLQPEGGYDAKTCLPSNEDGLIRPFIEFSRTAVLEETTKKPSETNHWNADQSRNKQPQPNDSGSLNIASNANMGEAGILDYHPYNQPNQRKQHNPDIGVDRAAFSGKSFQSPEEIDVFEVSHDGLKPEYAFKKHYVFNIGLIASVSVGGICVLVVITCVIYRCMRRDEGSYNVDESLAYTGEPTRTPTVIGHRSSKDPQISDSLTMRNLTKSEDEVQCLQMTGKTALIVTFSDTCKTNISTANSPCPLNSPKREAPTSPSLGSIESDKRKSDLIRIESPTERKTLSISKSKAGKKISDSQEWYV
ncbi:hypothetical protein CRM22_005562 [Opisthorchis felineus]|uniref:EGF-like domain-containing protein n=1 Tax=Opisthorchis felineus TaxID=147828 RepID=A0A4S2LXE8_OPIFE|nr:hypothetical protein CRM22_005562 [Opisthorchis felineus]